MSNNRVLTVTSETTGRPDGWNNLSQGQAVSGFSVGVLCIPGMVGLVPGNVQNASTFDFPVIYEVMRDISFEQIATGDECVVPAIVEAASNLASNGVRAIVGACGSLGHYQSAVANSVDIPVFMSILTHVPLLLKSLGENQRLAVIFATTGAFTAKIRKECGIDDTDRLVTIGLDSCPEFLNLLEPEKACSGSELARQVIAQVEPKIGQDVGALLLQCSDLPPLACDLQDYFGLPVFDMTSLINWVHSAVVRRPFSGHM